MEEVVADSEWSIDIRQPSRVLPAGRMEMSIVAEGACNQQHGTILHSLLDCLPRRIGKSKGRRKKNELWRTQQLALVFADSIGLAMGVVIKSPHGRLLRFYAQRIRNRQLVRLR